MKRYSVVADIDSDALVLDSKNAAKRIVDTANFIRNHMNDECVLTILDPDAGTRITLCHPVTEIANDLEKILCEYCAKEDTSIRSVVKRPTSHHIVVTAPLHAHAFMQNAVYVFSGGKLRYVCDAA